jgi:hypothetical protein
VNSGRVLAFVVSFGYSSAPRCLAIPDGVLELDAFVGDLNVKKRAGTPRICATIALIEI